MINLGRYAIITAICGALLVSCGAKRNDEFIPKHEYTLSVVIGPQYYWGMGAEKFTSLVRERTDGKINIKVYYGGQLFKGQQTDEFQLMSKGVIDFAWGSTINWSPVIKELNLFSLPFFISTYSELDKITGGETGQKLFNLMEAKGVEPLAWAENGFRQVTNSKRKIAAPGDLKGLKIRVVGSPIFIDTFKALAADPVSMNWGDAVTAFSQGVVDGQENPVGIMIPVKIWEYHRHVTLWNYVIDPVVAGCSLKLWREFPQDIRDSIIAAALDAAAWEKAVSRAGLDDGSSLKWLKEHYPTEIPAEDNLKILRDHGMEITELSEMREKFREATQPVYDKWIPQIGQDVYDSARADMNR